MKLTTDTFARPTDLSDTDDPAVLYARSYLLIRVVIGSVGILLPTMLFVIDALFFRYAISVRGSLSAYYHTPARDLFVGALCVIGFFLVTYMFGQKTSMDFWLSTVAGIAALGVALLPTKRFLLSAGDTLCGPGVEPVPAGCTPIQMALGESAVAAAHYAFAGIFILTLAALCFVFARREKDHTRNMLRTRFHSACGWVIIATVAWVAIGGLLDFTTMGIEPLYAGEVVSVYAFGSSWIVKAKDLLPRPVRRMLP